MSTQAEGLKFRGRIEGPDGPFEVVFTGTWPDWLHQYSYADTQEQCSFMAEFNVQPTIHWVIVSTTSKNLSREPVLRRNIELFFKTRDWTSPSQPGDASTAATPVTFRWKLAQ